MTAVAAMALLTPCADGGLAFTTLVSFSGAEGEHPGADPDGALVLGPDGNFYGTTFEGGSSNLGTIFRLAPDGAFKSLFSFNGANGANPKAGLTLTATGDFHGTTFAGGVSNWGTVFRFTTKGVLTSLSSFTGTNTPQLGANPAGALIQAWDGSFYGTATYGGLTNKSYEGFGYGTIFRLATDETVTAPFLFGNTNGARPSSPLVLGKDGCLYGTTAWGGLNIIGTAFPGFGTAFKITPDGTLTNIYAFSGGNDGGFIYAGLVQGRDGYLYGAAFNGGLSGYGTLFKISTNGAFTLLHTFNIFDSGSPYAGMIEGTDGNFYGTTYGAFSGLGSVFRITPAGQFATLVGFNGSSGARPDTTLLQGPDGNFYGTTSQGGANGFGTVFRLSVPLPPVIKTIARTNDAILLTWTAVAGQTYQLQYSTNLAQTNWNVLGGSVIATNGVMSATDPLGSDPQRLYRVALMP